MITLESYRVSAIVVTHNPDLPKLALAVNAIRPQVSELLLIDNGTEGSAIRAFSEREQLHGIFLHENAGLSKAQNIGIAQARNLGCTHVLLLDQDSIPGEDMLTRLMQADLQLLRTGIAVSAIGPVHIDPVTGHRSPFARIRWTGIQRVGCMDPVQQPMVEADLLISSGLLISLKVLQQVGDMDESFFMDCIDTEWFLRARSEGLRAFGICTATMQHRIGQWSHRFWLGRWRSVPFHEPVRHYYMARNSIRLYRMPHTPMMFILADAVRLLGMFIFFMLFVRSGRSNARMMLLGAWHGICGRAGSIKTDSR